MNFQQLRALREAVRHNFNLTVAAEALFTSQPGVSKQIKELEDELGVIIFERHGKRLVGLTEPGKAVLAIANRVLEDAENLRNVGREFAAADVGTLTLATTHTQARYALPRVVTEFKARFPKVRLVMHQGNPPQLAQMVLGGDADVAIATESLDHYPGLLALPAYTWSHCVVVPPQHPLEAMQRVTLEALAQYPIITYNPAFSGRSHIDEAFTVHGLVPDIVLTAIDADVIKTYVELGLGIGIIASVAFNAERDLTLRRLDASHLFRVNTTRVALRRGRDLRGFAYAFVELFAPHLSRTKIEQALRGEP
ncbi:MAG: CysB family HTH-type transcriptional regulator [Burkholderiales bacterium]